jgi:hypothetical protein
VGEDYPSVGQDLIRKILRQPFIRLILRIEDVLELGDLFIDHFMKR